ncbi:MAG: CoA activase [Planctomycetes bacterium]|nr:CoA activase [Planctomycetota bacterium]
MTKANVKRFGQTDNPELVQLDLPDRGSLHLGIDIGSVSCKLALLDDEHKIRYLRYQRTQGRPMEVARAMLADLFGQTPPDRVATIVGTGSAGRSLCDVLGIDFINELICQAAAIGYLRPEARTLIEMGGQDSKVIFLPERQGHKKGGDQSGAVAVADMVDFSMNAVCAAGTGSFLDQQASRIGVDIESEFGELALKSEVPPRVAGRCSVFAKSDMIHLQQQATPVYDIVAGLCLGLARNLKSSLCQGKEVVAPVAFCGGVASNAGVVRALEDVFELGRGGLIVPEEHAVTGAIGAVLVQLKQGAGKESKQEPRVLLAKLDEFIKGNQTIGHRLDALKEPGHAKPESKVHQEVLDEARKVGRKIPAFLGVDVGSISTNVVVMDEQKRVLSKAYLMTAGRPLEAVRKGLDMVAPDVRDLVEIRGVATTGSGRYLTGDFVGADLVINEITAQATGAAIVDPKVDTIFEIGGQDSKYISLDEGVVVDFEMNHACAAGTGSFLEEQAERLGMSIKEEFANEGFTSKAPIRLGERCTVFMESDLLSYQQQGAERPDLVAGLAYSIVTNYLNRVVSHRQVGQRIFFQGGTAFNRAVVSAFEAVTGKPIIVPDHHEVTGALGAADLARRHMEQKAREEGDGEFLESTFRGFDLSQMEYKVRSFECEHCANNCEIKEVIMPGSDPLYYGSRCDRYNVKKDQTNADELPDLFRWRQEQLKHYAGLDKQKKADQGESDQRQVVGIPMCLSNYQFLPLWGTFLKELGFKVVLSGRSTKSVIHKGVESVLAQPCFPVKVAHGHVLHLLNMDVDFIWLPSVVSMPEDDPENKHNQLCPYVQTIPYQVRTALKAKGIDLTGPKHHLLDLHVRFQDGLKPLRKNLWALVDKLKVSKSQINKALDVGLAAQKEFEDGCRRRGKEAMEQLKPDQKACVVVSRPYNGCDPGVSLDLPLKLRRMNVLPIPLDFLTLADANITEPELQREMYWTYGQRIFRAAHIIREDPRLYAIFLSNFSCGPDSFIGHFFKELMTYTDATGDERRKPCLLLEIDEHSADAGVVTRLEAFHESLKAVARHQEGTDTNVTTEQSPDSPWREDWGDCSGRTLYIPWMGDHAYALAAAFRYCGQPAEVLPIGDEETLRWGHKFTSGKECLPCIITTGDMLKKMNEPEMDPEKMAFFMPGSSGPCRFGQYSCLQRLVLKQSGFPNSVPVVSPNQDGNFYKHFERFREDPTRLSYNGIAAIDLIYKVLLKIRPYEVTVGAADEAYENCLERIVQAIEAGTTEKGLLSVMERCTEEMAQVKTDRSQPKPVICVVGEIYVRSHVFANDNIVRKLEALGGEVHLACFVEWLYYTNHTRKLMAERWGDYGLKLQNYLKNQVQHKIEKRLAKPLEKYFGPLAEGDITEVLEVAEPYMHESFEGEAILSIGKIVETYHHGAAGAVNVMPFTCMPSTIVSGISRQISADANGLPIINISYDGQQDPTMQTRLEAFMHQTHTFMRQQVQIPVTESVASS